MVSNILNNNNSINLIRPKVTRLENSNFLNDERDKKAGQNNRNNWDMLQKGLQKEKNAIRNAMKNINKIEQKMKKQKSASPLLGMRFAPTAAKRGVYGVSP